MAKKKTSPANAKKTGKTKKRATSKSKFSARKKSACETNRQKKPKDRLKDENVRLREEIKALRNKATKQSREIASLQGKMETRAKREEAIMKTLKISMRSKKNSSGVIGDLNSSILKAESYMLHMGKRIDNILAAIKNHREYLIKLNRKVHTHDARKRIEMEVEIMNNSLSIMALSGFDINKSLFSDVKKMRKMMEKKDVELSKLKKKLENLERKFEDEMERFDYESIFKKSDDIPGYR